ncbi:hypothetical protein CEUSTIGMA_g13899.t1 [Chlamydomonas eustigma]|uniref:Uncharacterized protein n=1 Tax=Chlamydomonas eustigma TaxID=1157962 RepID=A0A250XUJ1_9CHLO|nr:hypothetical protein CEUSTIGMA_g13899.t1 [Chlamydomonas eustigma]|eukprot:GAX86490.1 hypothetical protein CEUSTIGMA_g13899.t1 [Chlamydomonas eustigma]
MSAFHIRLTSDDLLSQPAYGEQDNFSQYSRDAPPGGTQTQQDEFENGIIMPDHYTKCIKGILLPTQATDHAIAADEQQQEEVEVEEDEQLIIQEEKQKKRRRKSTTAGGSSTEQPLSAEFIALAAQLHNLGSPLTLSDVCNVPIHSLRNLVAHTERQMLTEPPVRLVRTVKEAAKPKPPKQKVVTITLPSTLPAEEAATSKQPLKKRVAPALAASTAAVESLQKKHKTAAAVVGTSKEPTNSPATVAALEGTEEFLESFAIEMDIGEELTKIQKLFHLLKPYVEGDLKKFNSVRKKLGLKELDSFGQKATISIGSGSSEESSSEESSSDSDSDREEANKKGQNAAKANKISSR